MRIGRILAFIHLNADRSDVSCKWIQRDQFNGTVSTATHQHNAIQDMETRGRQRGAEVRTREQSSDRN